MAGNDEWLRSKAARQLCCPDLRDERLILSRLREALLEGFVLARATNAKLKRASRVERVAVMKEWPVDQKIWSGDSNNSYFSLETDQFSSSSYGTGFAKVELWGLSFHRQSLVHFFGIDETPHVEQIGPSDDEKAVQDWAIDAVGRGVVVPAVSADWAQHGGGFALSRDSARAALKKRRNDLKIETVPGRTPPKTT